MLSTQLASGTIQMTVVAKLMVSWRLNNEVGSSAVRFDLVFVMNIKPLLRINDEPVKKFMLLTETEPSAAINIAVSAKPPRKLKNAVFIDCGYESEAALF